ncbi:MAG: 3-dehydroquinate synthase, partial [Firmicutes bacterium]|nr:3-dehydroquinate synthase [Bacillota bacterium]
VIGDLAGFVAATYLRGISFVQVPTTLLAQIDSSIGGKVAVNLPAGKNLVGAFHQPRLVAADTGTLRTLPERELRAGLVEMLKHGLLRADYFAWYEEHLPALLARDEGALADGIAESCRIKAAVVLADERERGGPRTLLNLGHTVGHALENVVGYGILRHGEAVGLGLIVAGRLSRRRGFLGAKELERIERAVAATLGPYLPRLSREQLDPIVAAFFRDKKTLGGRLRFVLLRGPGEAFVDEGIDPETVRAELEGLLESGVAP